MSPKYQVDALVTVKTPTDSATLPCEVKRSHLSRETAQRLVHDAKEVPGLLVFAPAIGQEAGDLFQRESVNFVDLAGNCYLNLSDQYVARIQGRRAVTPKAADKGFRAAAFRVLFALLVEPRLIAATTRAAAVAAGGVSPQTVTDLRDRLVQRGLVLRSAAGFRWARGKRKEAMELWLAGFSTTLFPNLLVGRFRSAAPDTDTLETELAPLLDQLGEWRWGGDAAAMRLTKFYRGEQTLIYLKDAPPAEVARRLRLVPDRDGPLALAQAPGPLAFRSPVETTVHPLLAYADLLLEANDRAGETARILRERFLLAPEAAE